jgi:hypothetical protein
MVVARLINMQHIQPDCSKNMPIGLLILSIAKMAMVTNGKIKKLTIKP